MNRKAIKNVLRKKLNQLIESIEDKAVKKLVKDNTIITGGCIASMLLGEEVNDFDLYFTNKETVIAVAEYYIKRYNTETGKVSPTLLVSPDEARVRISIKNNPVAMPQDDEELPGEGDLAFDAPSDAEAVFPFRPRWFTDNAISLSGSVQLIVRFYGEPEEVHKNFDFVHCMCYWTSAFNNLVLPPDSLESLLAKELRYNGSLYPLCSIIRTRKFINRGWKCNAGQYLKMCIQLNELNLKDIPTLQDQVAGVDSLYFMRVLELLQEKADSGDKLENTYIIEIIDRIF